MGLARRRIIWYIAAMKFYKLLDNERKALEKSIAKKEKYIKAAPDGVLRCYRCRDYSSWYIVTSKRLDDGKVTHSRKYLAKKDHVLAEKMALKGLYENELKDERRELKAINAYLKNCSRFEAGNRYINSVDEYSRLLETSFKSKRVRREDYVKEWQDKRSGILAPYQDERKIPTKAGIKVRSKSEREIINLLLKYNIPFKYEESVRTENGHLFPDFTVLNVKTGKELIWEHNGMMDNERYAKHTFDRIATYYKVGYRPGKNLILTYEEHNEGIDEQMVEFLIQHMILEGDASE